MKDKSGRKLSEPGFCGWMDLGIVVQTTHPDIATLVDPLFSFAGKRVKEMFPCSFALYPFFAPLSAAGEERVVQRSADRVSKLYACNFMNYYPLGRVG